jgi:hypothetical protein
MFEEVRHFGDVTVEVVRLEGDTRGGQGSMYIASSSDPGVAGEGKLRGRQGKRACRTKG